MVDGLEKLLQPLQRLMSVRRYSSITGSLYPEERNAVRMVSWYQLPEGEPVLIASHTPDKAAH